MDDVETTIREAEETVARVNQMLSEGEALLKRGDEFTARGLTPELARAFLERQPAELRERAEREIEALQAEIERDTPKLEARRGVRIRSTRIMV